LGLRFGFRFRFSNQPFHILRDIIKHEIREIRENSYNLKIENKNLKLSDLPQF
jgi:hypothetical protein